MDTAIQPSRIKSMSSSLKNKLECLRRQTLIPGPTPHAPIRSISWEFLLPVTNGECDPNVFHNIWHKEEITKRKKKVLCVCSLLGIEPGTLCLPGKHCTIELKKPLDSGLVIPCTPQVLLNLSFLCLRQYHLPSSVTIMPSHVPECSGSCCQQSGSFLSTGLHRGHSQAKGVAACALCQMVLGPEIYGGRRWGVLHAQKGKRRRWEDVSF